MVGWIKSAWHKMPFSIASVSPAQPGNRSLARALIATFNYVFLKGAFLVIKSAWVEPMGVASLLGKGSYVSPIYKDFAD